MKVQAPLAALDSFSREVRLECCGHLSSFDIEGVSYTVSPSSGGFFGGFVERSMKTQLRDVVFEGMRFHHTYGFDTSTELKLRVVGERKGRIGREPLRFLSCNEALIQNCPVCDEPADWVCTACTSRRIPSAAQLMPRVKRAPAQPHIPIREECTTGNSASSLHSCSRDFPTFQGIYRQTVSHSAEIRF